MEIFKGLALALSEGDFRSLFLQGLITPEYRQIPSMAMRLGALADRANQGDPMLSLIIMMYLVLTCSSNADQRYPRAEDWQDQALLGFHPNQWFGAFL